MGARLDPEVDDLERVLAMNDLRADAVAAQLLPDLIGGFLEEAALRCRERRTKVLALLPPPASAAVEPTAFASPLLSMAAESAPEAVVVATPG